MITKHIVTPGSAAQLYLTFSDNIDGPFHPTEDGFTYISEPYAFCEGPAVIKIENYYYCYFDLSREHRMACKRNTHIAVDGWEDMTDQLNFPSDVKHGDIIRIPIDIYNKLDEMGGKGLITCEVSNPMR